MEITPSIFNNNYCQRITAWIVEQIPSAQSKVSRTKVQVLPSTHCIPTGPESNWPNSPSPKLRETWARKRGPCPKPGNYPVDEKRVQEDARLVNETAGKSSRRARDRHGVANDDDPQPCCLCLPIPSTFRKWRRQKQARVAPFSTATSFNPPWKSLKGKSETQVEPLITEVSVFDLEDNDVQETPSHGLPSQAMMRAELERQKNGNKLHLLQDEEEFGDISRISLLPPSRPMTSRGIRRDMGDPPSVIERVERSSEEVNTWFRADEEVKETVEDKVVWERPDVGLEMVSDEKDSLLEDNSSSSEVLMKIWRSPASTDDEGTNGVVSSSKVDEYDSWVRIEDAVASRQETTTTDNECQQVVYPMASRHSLDEGGSRTAPEEDLQYELQQCEQWQLAITGEWSTVCQDEDEDEYETECYLRKDEFKKEEDNMNNWKATVAKYQSVGVIQDLQTMQTLSKCTINQSERALRQFARICRGPVPLSQSGQTKAEAITSLSRKVQEQTKRISEEISSTFLEFYHIFEELDVLRERQDRVEDSLRHDLKTKDLKKKKYVEVELSRQSSRSSTCSTPRRANSRLKQWEIDLDLMDLYTEGVRVRSRSLITILPTIREDAIFNVKEELEECQEDTESEIDFPEYNGMDGAGSNDDMADNFEDTMLTTGLEENQEENEKESKTKNDKDDEDDKDDEWRERN